MGLLSFFDRFRASSDDRSAWGDFWFSPVTTRSVSGMRVSADSAMRLAAVYACVRILSETMASLPLVLYRQRKDGGKDRVTDHWLYQVLAKRPNRYQNPFEWREMLQGHLALRGNAFCQIITDEPPELRGGEGDDDQSEDAQAPPDPLRQRLRRLVEANAGRLARRISKKAGLGASALSLAPPDLELIAAALGRDMAAVQAWAWDLATPLNEAALVAALIDLGTHE